MLTNLRIPTIFLDLEKLSEGSSKFVNTKSREITLLFDL